MLPTPVPEIQRTNLATTVCLISLICHSINLKIIYSPGIATENYGN